MMMVPGAPSLMATVWRAAAGGASGPESNATKATTKACRTRPIAQTSASWMPERKMHKPAVWIRLSGGFGE
jgi:hypothetical protein